MHKHCVLVIEDDADARAALASLLETCGFCAVPAADGAAALHKLRDGLECCAIVLDLVMPRMDGWTFRSEQLRDAALAEVPLMLLSGREGLAGTARTLGVRDFMAKPVDVGALVEWVRSHCHRVQ